MIFGDGGSFMKIPDIVVDKRVFGWYPCSLIVQAVSQLRYRASILFAISAKLQNLFVSR